MIRNDERRVCSLLVSALALVIGQLELSHSKRAQLNQDIIKRCVIFVPTFTQTYSRFKIRTGYLMRIKLLSLYCVPVSTEVRLEFEHQMAICPSVLFTTSGLLL